MYIAKNLKYLREQRQLSQQRITELLKLKSNGLYQHYEGGRAIPPLPVLLKLSDMYDVSVKDMALTDLEISIKKQVVSEEKMIYSKYMIQPPRIKKAIDCLLGIA